jgi:hypothetical protein
LPNLLAIDDAGSMDRAAMKLVMKKMVPNLLSGKVNLLLKKKVIQELERD